jgi:glycosyltransferase involved in cell wall biosynthesis
MSSVSVVIPTFNGVAYIGEALESVYAQTRRPDEIIVVDDASPDGTADHVAALVRSAPVRLRLIRLDKNSGGPARPINRGIQATTSELIAVLDQDDAFVPEKLEKQARILTGNAQLAFAFCLCGKHDEARESGHAFQTAEIVQKLQAVGIWQDDHYRIEGRAMFRMLFLHGNFVIGYPAFVFRRKWWERKGGLDERLRVASDFDLLTWLSLCGPAGFSSEKLYLRRTHTDNLSLTWWKRHYQTATIPDDEIVIRRRCFAQQPWLLEDTDAAPGVRARIVEMAEILRETGWRPLDIRVLRAWLAGDPDFPAAFLERTIPRLLRHWQNGQRHEALRLLWQCWQIGGWNSQTRKVTTTLVRQWVRFDEWRVNRNSIKYGSRARAWPAR